MIGLGVNTINNEGTMGGSTVVTGNYSNDLFNKCILFF